MNSPWGKAGPLPEAVAPPIFPIRETPRKHRVKSPYLEDYRTIRVDNKGHILEEFPSLEANRLAQKIVDNYGWFPIGTLQTIISRTAQGVG
jgi:hypothetical protein